MTMYVYRVGYDEVGRIQYSDKKTSTRVIAAAMRIMTAAQLVRVHAMSWCEDPLDGRCEGELSLKKF
jgi:hypothetical protein